MRLIVNDFFDGLFDILKELFIKKMCKCATERNDGNFVFNVLNIHKNFVVFYLLT